MDEKTSLLLQKQVRDNSEDLQKELLDLKIWEQEMKRKEEELLNSTEEIKILPPIRNKKKKIIETSPPIPSTSKESIPERIKSYDYSSWSQYDVDAACRKLDEENESDEEEDDVINSAEKKHSEAVKFKVDGNNFFQKKQYDLAINSYSQAIKIFPYDEVFYANRALCYLKQDNLYSAEADCTAALQINDSYVKAYHRRATARIELEDYNGAKEDIKRVLNLEPSNKEAKSMLSKINKKFEKYQPLKITEVFDDTPIEKKIGEKICNTKINEQEKIQKPQIEEVEKLQKSSKLTITEVSSESENEKSSRNNKSTKSIIKESSNESEKKLPDWLPKIDENYSIVEPIELPPHQRSKETMKKMTIKKVNFGNNILPIPHDENNSNINKKIAVKEENKDKIEKIDTINLHKNIIETKQEKNNDVIKKQKTPFIEVINSQDIPSAPKTAVQFLTEWKRNKSQKFRAFYLKQIRPNTIPTLFKDSMESSVLEDIIMIIREEFTRNEMNIFFIFDYLDELSNIKRFRTLIMFIDRKTKEALKELLEHCKTVEDKSEKEIDRLRQKYEL